MKKDNKNITLRQIAKLARTSKSTVSRVLTKHPSVSPKTRARVEAVIQKQGFRPNLFARGLAGGRTGLIAVLASEMNSGFIAEVIKGIDEIAGQHDGHILSSFAHGSSDFIRLWRELAEGGRADGIILIAPPIEIFNNQVEPEYIPCVLCASQSEQGGRGWGNTDSVVLGNRKGMEELLKHLVEQGCKHMVHVAGPADIFDAVERRRTFEEFVAKRPELSGEVISATLNRDDGRMAVMRYLRENRQLPDAFVAANDLTAVGTMEALKEFGVTPNRRVAITGCDDDPASAYLGLTTLHMPMVELGRETARLLFSRLQNREAPPRNSMIDLALRVRESSILRDADSNQ